MKLPKRATIVLNALAFAVILWLYGGDWINYWRARSAPAAAFQRLPNVAFASVALVAALGGAGLFLWASWQAKADGFKGYRLLPIAAVVVIFVDMFMVTGARGPTIPAPEQLGVQMWLLANKLEASSTPNEVPSDPTAVSKCLEQLGAPPYLSAGKAMEHFTLQFRTGCEKPVTEAPGVGLGTVIYCLAPKASMAWVSVVALPYEQPFGSPSVFSKGGEPQFWSVLPKEPEELEPGALDGGAGLGGGADGG